MTRLALRVTVSASALAAAAAAFSLAGAAQAQTATNPPPAQGQTAATAVQGAPPVVTVTAERRAVNLQTAPIAATVIGGSQLQDNGIYTLDDLQFHTPSLTITDNGGAILFNIRGLGKDIGSVQAPSGVVSYFDGVATFPGFFESSQYYDIANIEVLRGPQGTFAGQNADAGAVFVTTNDPRIGTTPSADVELQYGSYNDELLRGDLNMPAGDTVSLRVAWNLEQRDSFYHVSGPWTDPEGKTPGAYRDEAFRIGLLWQPTSNFKAVLKYDYDYFDDFGVPNSPSQALGGPLGFEANPAPLFDTTLYTNTYAKENVQRLSLNASYSFNDGIVLKSITAYQYGRGGLGEDLTILGYGANLSGFAPPFPDGAQDWGREQIFSQEVDLVSPTTGPLTWIGGLYYQHDYVTLLPGGGNLGYEIDLPGFGISTVLHYKTPKNTEAGFGQVSYDITPALQLQVGARLTHEDFGLWANEYDVYYGTNIIFPFVANNLYVNKTSDTELTGKIALNWKLDDNNFLYAFVATGSKGSAINTNPAGNQTSALPFGPEHVIDYEAGWKPTLADGHVRLQLDAYYDQYQDFQLSFANPSAPANNFIRNVGGTTTLYGFEAEGQAVFGAFSADAGASYEHTSLGSAVVLDPGPSAATGLFGQMINLKGRTLPLAPTWTFNAGAQYALPVGNGTLTPRIDYSYISSQWGTPYQDVGDYLPGHDIVNATITYAIDRYSITAYATNAFNTKYLIGSSIGIRYPGDPAQYGVRLNAKF